MTATSALRAATLCAALLAWADAGSATAQDLRVAGRIVGPGGAPAAGQTVVLHRVTGDGGTLLAEATADTEGRFVLEAAGPAPEGAVYFVASRFEGRLYIGPMLRPPFDAGTEVTLEIGDPARALGTATPAAAPTIPVQSPGAATGTPRRWLLLLAPLAGLLGIVVWAGSAVTGPPRDRRILIQLARLDNRFREAGAGGDRAEYEKRRRRLLDELDAAT